MENEFRIYSLLATVVFGSVLIAIIYHSIVYFFIRDYLVRHYVVFLLFLGIYTAYVSGIFEFFFGENIQKYYRYYLAEGSQMLYLSFYNLFVFKAIDLDKKKHPVLFHLWNLMIWIIFFYGVSITAFVIIANKDYHDYVFFWLVRLIVFAIAIILISMYTKVKANLFQKIVYYGSIVYLMFGILSTYVNYSGNFKPLSPLEWLVLGGFIDIIFFSAALNYRIRKTIYDLNKNLLKNANEKIKIQEELIQKQNDLENERKRIAADMHDDLGSGLTKINYLARIPNMPQNLEKIKETSSDLIESMSIIIWAMKQENNSLQDLLTYIKMYAVDYLESNDIELHIKIPELQNNLAINGNVRRNIFLIIKEILHNMVKHSRTEKAILIIEKTNNLSIEIGDYGIGFDYIEKDKNKGNGLGNMRYRIEKMNGIMQFQSNKNGTFYRIKIPLSELENP